MIPFFLGYALLIWIPAARFRREWLGFAIVLLGALGLVGISLAHFELRRMDPSWFIQGMQVLLYPYTAMVTAVGLFIAALPRTFKGGCPWCAYSLTGLPLTQRECPECGLDLNPDRCPVCHTTLCEESRRTFTCASCGFNTRTSKTLRRHRQSGAERSDLRASDGLSSPREAVHDSAQQDHPGQTRDERPPERPPS